MDERMAEVTTAVIETVLEFIRTNAGVVVILGKKDLIELEKQVDAVLRPPSQQVDVLPPTYIKLQGLDGETPLFT